MGRSFDSLVDEAAELSVEGWVFSWLGGRATEERPSWGYQRLLSQRLAKATAALDIQTGGGEVLAGAGAENFPRTLVATEGWPPNVAKATARCFICRRRPDGAVLGLPIRQARRLTGRLRRAHEMTPQPTPGETQVQRPGPDVATSRRDDTRRGPPSGGPITGDAMTAAPNTSVMID